MRGDGNLPGQEQLQESIPKAEGSDIRETSTTFQGYGIELNRNRPSNARESEANGEN